MQDDTFERDVTRLLESRGWEKKTLSEIDRDVQTMIVAAMRVHMAAPKNDPPVGYTMGKTPPPIKPLSCILARCYTASVCCD